MKNTYYEIQTSYISYWGHNDVLNCSCKYFKAFKELHEGPISYAVKHSVCLNQPPLEKWIMKRFVVCLLQDMFYHFIALLCYFGAFLLEAATTSAWTLTNGTAVPSGNILTVLSVQQHNINVAATVSIWCWFLHFFAWLTQYTTKICMHPMHTLSYHSITKPSKWLHVDVGSFSLR